MDFIKGKVLLPQELIAVKEGYTISKALAPDTVLFSLAKHTDISAEKYLEDKLYIILQGEATIGGARLQSGDALVMPKDSLFGIKANGETILIEIIGREDDFMNLEKGKVFRLADQIEVIDGAIANFDIVNHEGVKFMLLSLDEGQALSPHAAPGDALVIALEGKARVSMDGKYSEIEAGEQFVFQKDLTHSVEALTPFKMALLLVVE